jgi:hypothetical protein
MGDSRSPSPLTGCESAATETAEAWLAELPRPLTLLGSKGSAAHEAEGLPADLVGEFYREFLDRCDGSLVVLDADDRALRMASFRLRCLDELGPCSGEGLRAALRSADLIVGAGSTPMHAARGPGTPAIGVWPPGHHPNYVHDPASRAA